MKKRTRASTKIDQFHLRLPTELLEWYRQRAGIERRKINEVMTAALENYRTEVAMNELSLTEPIKIEDCERCIVWIVKNGLAKGAGEGDTPEKATQAAKTKIEQGKGEIVS